MLRYWPAWHRIGERTYDLVGKTRTASPSVDRIGRLTDQDVHRGGSDDSPAGRVLDVDDPLSRFVPEDDIDDRNEALTAPARAPATRTARRGTAYSNPGYQLLTIPSFDTPIARVDTGVS